MRPENPLISSEYEVRDCDPGPGKEIIRQNHYSRGCSNTFVYLHGLFHEKRGLVGVASWLPPTRVCAESVNRRNWRRVLSLSRLVVLDDEPTNAASFLIGRSIRIIKRDGKWVSLVTYADGWQGHSGSIYRATNWTYLGETRPTQKWIDPISGRQVSKKSTKNRTKAQMLAKGYEMIGSFKKHKFVYHLQQQSGSASL